MAQPAYFSRLDIPAWTLAPELQEIIGSEDYYDNGFQVENGIFSLAHSDVGGGEYTEIEEYLVENKVPFDRYSEANDHGAISHYRYFRPASEHSGMMDQVVPCDPDGGFSIPVDEIRTALTKTRNYRQLSVSLRELLDRYNPQFPPLELYTKS